MYDDRRRSPMHTIFRIFFGILLVAAFVIFVLWRTENPRLQGLRMAVLDTAAPFLEGLAGPSNAFSRLFDDVQSYSELQSENERLRAQVERLRAWRDVARSLEEENAQLRALNAVKPPPRVSFVTADVVGDAGGPFAQSVVVNVGLEDGVEDGAPAVDGSGLVGRVAGVGRRSARILLLTDANSRVPVIIGADRRRAVLTGRGDGDPTVEFLSNPELIEEGAAVVSSGDGGVFPDNLLVGHVISTEGGEIRARLAADFGRLEFVRIYRATGLAREDFETGLIRRARPRPATEDLFGARSDLRTVEEDRDAPIR